MSSPLEELLAVGEAVGKAASVLRVLGPVAEQVDAYLHRDGPEPAVFQQLPELRAPAALERARLRRASP